MGHFKPSILVFALIFSLFSSQIQADRWDYYDISSINLRIWTAGLTGQDQVHCEFIEKQLMKRATARLRQRGIEIRHSETPRLLLLCYTAAAPGDDAFRAVSLIACLNDKVISKRIPARPINPFTTSLYTTSCLLLVPKEAIATALDKALDRVLSNFESNE